MSGEIYRETHSTRNISDPFEQFLPPLFALQERKFGAAGLGPSRLHRFSKWKVPIKRNKTVSCSERWKLQTRFSSCAQTKMLIERVANLYVRRTEVTFIFSYANRMSSIKFLWDAIKAARDVAGVQTFPRTKLMEAERDSSFNLVFNYSFLANRS